MTYTGAYEQTGTQSLGFAADQIQVVKVQFVIDSHRITGDFRYGGPPRRLVDLLNALDGGYATLFNGALGSAQKADEDMKDFEVAQVRRDAILYAIPLSATPAAGSYAEAVRKIPVPTTLGLPGYDITGNCYHAPEADPIMAPVLSSRSFIPMTDAVIRPTFKAKIGREELVVVNLARVLVYAPNVQAG